VHPPASNCSAHGFSGLVAHSWKKAYPDLLPFASVPLHLANFAIQPSWLFPFIVLSQNLFCWNRFPLVRSLPSTASDDGSITRPCSAFLRYY
jgi:hypothetical protein